MKRKSGDKYKTIIIIMIIIMIIIHVMGTYQVVIRVLL